MGYWVLSVPVASGSDDWYSILADSVGFGQSAVDARQPIGSFDRE